MGNGEKWRKTILAKYGSMEAYSAHLYRVKVDKYAGGDEDKYKELMREWQKKSRVHYSGNGGIRSLTPAQHKAMSIKGGQSRWANRENNK